MGVLKRLGYLGFVAGTGGAGAAAKWAATGTQASRERKKQTAELRQQTAMLQDQIDRANGAYDLYSPHHQWLWHEGLDDWVTSRSEPTEPKPNWHP